MNRRQFLTLRSERRLRIVELSCERLHMLALDAQLTCAPREHVNADVAFGEPPAAFDRRTAEQLFDEIDRELAGADVLRITGAAWLASGALGGRLDPIVDRFRAHGGRVEIS